MSVVLGPEMISALYAMRRASDQLLVCQHNDGTLTILAIPERDRAWRMGHDGYVMRMETPTDRPKEDPDDV